MSFAKIEHTVLLAMNECYNHKMKWVSKVTLPVGK